MPQEYAGLFSFETPLDTFAKFKEKIPSSSSWQGSIRFAFALSKQQEGKAAPPAKLSGFGREIEHSVLLRLFLRRNRTPVP